MVWFLSGSMSPSCSLYIFNLSAVLPFFYWMFSQGLESLFHKRNLSCDIRHPIHNLLFLSWSKSTALSPIVNLASHIIQQSYFISPSAAPLCQISPIYNELYYTCLLKQHLPQPWDQELWLESAILHVRINTIISILFYELLIRSSFKQI